MKRVEAAVLAALLALVPAHPTAAASPEPAAEPFPVVPLPAPLPRSYRAAWLTLGAGAGAITASFILHDRANRSYREYLDSTDPDRLDGLFDRSERLDRISGGSLLAGEVLLATGVYLRFLRVPPTARMAVSIGPGRWSATWRF